MPVFATSARHFAVSFWMRLPSDHTCRMASVPKMSLKMAESIVPVGMVDSQFVRSKLFGIPLMRRPGVRIGPPMDFSRYAGAGNDRDVLRWVTDEIMTAVMKLSGQTYVDAYGASVKAALAEGREFPVQVLGRPGEGRPVPPVPVPSDAAR